MNKAIKIVIVALLIGAAALAIVVRQNKSGSDKVPAELRPEQLTRKGLPVMIDLGSDQCIPCKMMAPILEELKTEYAEKLSVHFLDVRKLPALSKLYNIKLIPTQIFYDASGKEIFRHEGFYAKDGIIAKWKEFGVDLAGPAAQMPAFERLMPARTDNRTKDQICYMCDGDINIKTLVTVQTDKGPVLLCSPHCYFIMYSCLTEDKTGFENKVSVIDWSTGKSVPATNAVYLYDMDSETGRPVVKAFADKGKAEMELKTASGSIISLEILKDKELATRCGFCDRAVYPQNAATVIAAGLHTWGCCSHCALGVAARTGNDIEVHEKDRLTGEEIIVNTLDGKIASLEPVTAVAWFGQRQKPDGTWGSAGCFHQGFFVNVENLKKWVEQNPYETGRLISISQALADKMKLTPQQIQKACKIGECVPK
jgi:thiol-disulfide isomerase/thioredoxin